MHGLYNSDGDDVIQIAEVDNPSIVPLLEEERKKEMTPGQTRNPGLTCANPKRRNVDIFERLVKMDYVHESAKSCIALCSK